MRALISLILLFINALVISFATIFAILSLPSLSLWLISLISFALLMFLSAFCKALSISANAFCFWALVKLELFRISWRFLLAKSIISCLAKILASINAFNLSISF